MAVLFYDTFGGTVGDGIASRLADSGGSWDNQTPGTDFKLAAGGTCYPDGVVKMFTNNTGVGNAEVEADITVKSSPSPTDQYFGVHLRGSGSAYWMVAFNQGSLYQLINLDSTVGGDTTAIAITPTLDDNFHPLYGVGQHTLKASVTGTGTALYRGFIDNREVIRFGSVVADSGRFGIQCGGATTSTTGNHFSSFQLSTDFSRNQVQFVSDSMGWGVYSTAAGATLTCGLANQWPQLVMNRISLAGGDADWANLSSSGKTLAAMNSSKLSVLLEMGTPYRAYAHGGNAGYGYVAAARPNATRDIVVLMGAINDFLGGGGSAAAAYADITAIVAAAQAAGQYFIILTVPRCDEGVHTNLTVPAGFNVKIDALNALIIANAAGADDIVNLSADSRISTETTNWTYRADGDGVHWTPSAQQLVADLVYPAVATGMGISTAAGGYMGGGYGGYILGA
jgi:lysophospholipase L1-like esterase